MSTPLSRRSALRGAAVAGGAAVVGFVVGLTRRPGAGQGATTAANAYGAVASTGRRLAALADVPAGGALVVPGAKVVLVRAADNTVQGFSAVCTHQGCTVSGVQDGQIVCPCHGSAFSARTGAVTSGPATRPLAKVPVEVRDDAVYST
jgi:Rieske Fe-S protein